MALLQPSFTPSQEQYSGFILGYAFQETPNLKWDAQNTDS